MLQSLHPVLADGAVLFDSERHRYTLRDAPAKRLTTVTQAVSALLPPFDAAAISAKLAKASKGHYSGMTPAAIRAEWNLAARLGTQMHAAIEEFYNGAKPESGQLVHLPEDFDEIDAFLRHELNLEPFRSELRMADAESLLAGTADQVFRNKLQPDEYVIVDWKRTPSVPKTNQYDRGRGELAHLEATKFLKFAMQLNLYAILLDKSCSLQAQRLLLIVFYPSGGYEVHDVPFMAEAQSVYDRHAAAAATP